MSITFTIGELTVHRVIEHEATLFSALDFFPTLTQELLDGNRAWLEPTFVDKATGQLRLCIQSYIVQTPHHNILIDSCVGNLKERPAYPFWHQIDPDHYERNFAAIGLTMNDIDYVMCTHMHVDHVGWNTRLKNGRWVPSFPKAKYVFAERELAFWTQKEREDPARFPWITDSVLPIVQAGRHEVVSSQHELSDVVKLIPTPGHTIDHFAVHVGRPGADAIMCGDMLHSPIQMRYPGLRMRVDYDPEQAIETRRNLFGRLCDTSTFLCPAHFPTPSKGRLTRWGEGFRFNLV